MAAGNTHNKTAKNNRGTWLIAGVFTAVVGLIAALIALSVMTNESEGATRTTASAETTQPVDASTRGPVEAAVETECAADLGVEMGLSAPPELYDLEDLQVSEDQSLYGLKGKARYPTASGTSMASDRFSCSILVKDDGTLTIGSFTH